MFANREVARRLEHIGLTAITQDAGLEKPAFCCTSRDSGAKLIFLEGISVV